MTSILIVEDDTGLREEISDWLELEGYHTLLACNGREGLAIAAQHTPDLIVSDIAMPEMDGFNFLLELRANRQLSDLPFIFLTASADYEFVRKGMGLGADDYLIKPFTHAELLNAISARLQRKQLHDEIADMQVNLLSQALQQERRLNSLQASISTMLSHDLRGLLTVVLSSSGLLKKYRERMTTQQQDRHIERIEGATYQIIHMLDDILLSAEMEADALCFQPEVVDLSTMVGKLVTEFQIITDETHTIAYQCPVNSVANVDRRLFRQIMANLLSNSVKYSPDGGDILVSLNCDDGNIILTVADKGIGISAEDIPRLFDPFFRAESVKKITGTGLGLPIVKRAVELHGGTIQVSSKAGEGTRFTIVIPQSLG